MYLILLAILMLICRNVLFFNSQSWVDSIACRSCVDSDKLSSCCVLCFNFKNMFLNIKLILKLTLTMIFLKKRSAICIIFCLRARLMWSQIVSLEENFLDRATRKIFIVNTCMKCFYKMKHRNDVIIIVNELNCWLKLFWRMQCERKIFYHKCNYCDNVVHKCRKIFAKFRLKIKKFINDYYINVDTKLKIKLTRERDFLKRLCNTIQQWLNNKNREIKKIIFEEHVLVIRNELTKQTLVMQDFLNVYQHVVRLKFVDIFEFEFEIVKLIVKINTKNRLFFVNELRY